MRKLLLLLALLVAGAAPALAQDAATAAASGLASLIPAGDTAVSGRIVQLFGIVTVLSVARAFS